MKYNIHDIRYKFYGRNVELLLEEAKDIKDDEERSHVALHIGRLMKGLYMEWNRENVGDETIVDHLRDLSDGKLVCDLDKIKEHDLFDVQVPTRRETQHHSPVRHNHRRGGQQRRPNNHPGRQNYSKKRH
ncbi:MAG: DUF4290 domain-containing protein [Cytophagales bacterium]|nr:DUF4290 domain-containing protein [Cytophagales bacterium]